MGLVNKEPVKGMQHYLRQVRLRPEIIDDFLALIGINELLEAARARQSIYDA